MFRTPFSKRFFSETIDEMDFFTMAGRVVGAYETIMMMTNISASIRSSSTRSQTFGFRVISRGKRFRAADGASERGFVWELDEKA